MFLKRWLRKEPVLCASVLLMLISMLFMPPNPGYVAYMDWKTLLCLWGLMAALKGLELEGLLEAVSLRLAASVHKSRSLVRILVFLCFFSAMGMTNDVALIALVPITLSLLPLCGLEKWAALVIVLETIAANIGSSLTPIGNPQNLYLFSYYDISLPAFISTTGPIVAVGGLLLYLSCLFIPQVEMQAAKTDVRLPMRGKFLLLYAGLFVLAVLAVFGVLSYWLAAGAILGLLLLCNRKLLLRVDYSLLLTFAAIFVFVGNLAEIAPVRAFLSGFAGRNAFLSAVVTSQFTSNVPAAVLLSGFTDNARALLAGTNVGGMGTLIASMASVISYKLFAGVHRGQTGRYMKLFSVWNLAFLVVLAAVAAIMLT